MNNIRDLIKDRGLKLEYIASKMGISVQTLTRKIDGQSSFKIKEALEIKKLLGIDDREFLKLLDKM